MADQVEEYVTSAVQKFVGDPPWTDYQWGFLSALLVVAKEAGLDMYNSPYAEARELERWLVGE